MPIMTAIIWRSARLTVAKLQADAGHIGAGMEDKGRYIAVGILALLLFLATETSIYIWIHREESKGWKNWLWDRDPVAGPAFFAVLGVFMALPVALA